MRIKKEVITILEQNKVQLAYIFGSYAKHENNNYRDIDVAIYLDEADKMKRFDTKCFLSSVLMKYFQKSIDIVILNDIKNLFLAYDIISEGKIILNKDDNLKILIESKLLHNFIDFRNSLILNNLYPNDDKTLSNRKQN